jgi:peptidoglycan/LPS O-acetylase OafA/YrhL
MLAIDREGGMAGRLAALTALRFFAAAAIVFHHAAGHWAFPIPTHFFLSQGVTFFFVLSGFILTYRYPRLDGRADIVRFLQARFARIWPAYVAALIIVLCSATAVLSSFDGNSLSLHVLANLLMIQSWLPTDGVSLNGPSWSISTEFAFYLMFP